MEHGKEEEEYVMEARPGGKGRTIISLEYLHPSAMYFTV